jgi:beta-galactosidase
MSRFEINSDFELDGKPIKILSGAIHYFRIPREDWSHSLYNLKALGFNTVETYIPWNFHETCEGEFDFTGQKDIKHFIELAQDIGLYVIIRPSPYICAEWDFGGLPAWLLNYRDMRIRSCDPQFLIKVESYFEILFDILEPLQIDQHGPIIMMQVENEYGSYGDDKTYLKKIYDMMRRFKVTVPLVTSDGAWNQTLRAGSMIDMDLLATGNFGSKPTENFENLKQFHQEYGKQWPLMCMEFWDGWFNRWGDDIIKRDSKDLTSDVEKAIEIGAHINLYMFQGGTNYGFWNGCSARGTVDLPQVTSYDYDAPVNEAGDPTEKYFSLQSMLKRQYPDIKQQSPKYREYMKIDAVPLANKVSLFSILEALSKKTVTQYPLFMEDAGDGYGYMLYRTFIKRETSKEKLRIVEARDRVHCYINEQLVYKAYQQEIGDQFEVNLTSDTNQVDVLVENMGRVNYGYKLLASTQRKGLGQGIMQDLHFVTNFEQYDIQFDKLKKSHFKHEYKEGTPAFYCFNFNVEHPKDTYIDLSGFGKGIVLVNGVNIGRYWDVGPTLSLYISKSLITTGENEIIIFETEGRASNTINFKSEPVRKTI